MTSIQSRYEDGVQVLTINNEPKRNAFTHEMTEQLGKELETAEKNRDVRCVVITGSGDVAFSSGHDLREMLANRDGASAPEANVPFLMPTQMATPTIAAVNGYAFAAGFILCISCDLRICAEHASFSAPGARIGLLPIGGQLSRLSALIPRGIAHELLITCREMKADEAYRIGFANAIAPRGEALSVALELAKVIAANSTDVVRSVKTGLELFLSQGATAVADFEWRVGKQLQNSPDADEGVRAFLEKRAPRFL